MKRSEVLMISLITANAGLTLTNFFYVQKKRGYDRKNKNMA